MTPSIISLGTKAESVTPGVLATTALVPGLPATRTNGDWLLAFTATTSTTAAVATPSGWSSLWNVVATNGRMVCFAREVDGAETAPTLTWTGLTAGNSGTPCMARVIDWSPGWLESGGSLVVDTVGAVSNRAADATIAAGGLGFTTGSNPTYVISHGVRAAFDISGVVDAGGEPVPWTTSIADATGSGTDFTWFMSHGSGPLANSDVLDHTYAITGGSSQVSSGVMIALALQPATDEVELTAYTRNLVPAFM